VARREELMCFVCCVWIAWWWFFGNRNIWQCRVLFIQSFVRCVCAFFYFTWTLQHNMMTQN